MTQGTQPGCASPGRKLIIFVRHAFLLQRSSWERSNVVDKEWVPVAFFDLVMSVALTAELERLDPRPRIAPGSEQYRS